MRMTVEEYRRRFPNRPEPIGMEYHGKWIAWDASGRRIVAHAETLQDLSVEVERLGIERPAYQKVPRGAFVGAGWR